MRKILLSSCFFLMLHAALGENRFGRPVVRVKDEKAYQLIKRDDVEYPTISNERYSVQCLVYRGTEHYYVEIVVANKTDVAVSIPLSFIAFDKPGYTVYRTDTMAAAREVAADANIRFVPTPPPYVPPTYNTTINATTTTIGDQTYTSGTATTTPDYSGQTGANLGNALGNAIAAHRFYKAERDNEALSHFLATHEQTDSDTALPPGQSRIIAATFEQAKPRKAPFAITVKVGAEMFRFEYKE